MILRNFKPLSMAFCALFSAGMMNGAFSHDLIADSYDHDSPDHDFQSHDPRHREDDHLGEWIGTWHSGDTSGQFDLALERASDGKLSGNIDVSTDGGKAAEFAVDLRHISFEGDNFTAIFVTPGTTHDVIRLTGSLTKQTGSGEWVAQRTEPATLTSRSGTWLLEKHERK